MNSIEPPLAGRKAGFSLPALAAGLVVAGFSLLILIEAQRMLHSGDQQLERQRQLSEDQRTLQQRLGRSSGNGDTENPQGLHQSRTLNWIESTREETGLALLRETVRAMETAEGWTLETTGYIPDEGGSLPVFVETIPGSEAPVDPPHLLVVVRAEDLFWTTGWVFGRRDMETLPIQVESGVPLRIELHIRNLHEGAGVYFYQGGGDFLHPTRPPWMRQWSWETFRSEITAGFQDALLQPGIHVFRAYGEGPFHSAPHLSPLASPTLRIEVLAPPLLVLFPEIRGGHAGGRTNEPDYYFDVQTNQPGFAFQGEHSWIQNIRTDPALANRIRYDLLPNPGPQRTGTIRVNSGGLVARFTIEQYAHGGGSGGGSPDPGGSQAWQATVPIRQSWWFPDLFNPAHTEQVEALRQLHRDALQTLSSLVQTSGHPRTGAVPEVLQSARQWVDSAGVHTLMEPGGQDFGQPGILLTAEGYLETWTDTHPPSSISHLRWRIQLEP